MPDLHITNGDGAANLLKNSSIAGDVLPWRDPMHHGPFPLGRLDTVSKIRAHYLGGDDQSDAERDFRLRDTHLRGFRNYDTVTLWFEHDLLDQLQIVQILDWFADQDLKGTALRMVCIDSFQGIDPFRGLGQLTPAQIGTLDGSGACVTPDQMDLAKTVWDAFRSENPLDLETVLQGDLGPLPFLKTALQRHFMEYPWSQTGLTRSESQLLALARDGVNSPVDLFVQNMDLEDAFFMGDWPTFRIIGTLCQGGLLTSPEPFRHPSFDPDDRKRFRDQRLSLTPYGQQVLDGQANAFAAMPRDMWLGGVHLHSDKPMWTWDADANRLRQRTP